MIEAYLVVSSSDPNNHYRIARTLSPSEKHHSIPLFLIYLAEGNANLIFRLLPLDAGSSIRTPQDFHNKLLRLRKDKSFITGTQQQHASFTTVFAPLFETGDLVEQSLIEVDRDVWECVNVHLSELEGSGERPESRHGEKVPMTERYGMLVTDMTALGAEVMVEIKPKWLLQSPNAPREAVRCRTCALRAMRDRGKGQKGKGKEAMVVGGSEMCPLALVAEGHEDRSAAAEAVLRGLECLPSPNAVEDLATLLEGRAGTVLRILRTCQAEFDPRGILDLEEDALPSEDFCKAMTLRDCIVFLRSKDGVLDDKTEIRVADLDMKEAHPDKVRKWRDTERRLLDGGWYTNAETDAKAETFCILVRKGPG